MAFVTSKITACGYAFCAAEMAEKLIKNLSENLPVEGACPRLWCRALFGIRQGFGGVKDKALMPPCVQPLCTTFKHKGLISLALKVFQVLAFQW